MNEPIRIFIRREKDGDIEVYSRSANDIVVYMADEKFGWNNDEYPHEHFADAAIVEFKDGEKPELAPIFEMHTDGDNIVLSAYELALAKHRVLSDGV